MVAVLSENDLLPTGKWVGFYLEPHHEKRGWMAMYLHFEDGSIQGEGTDYVGPWHLRGQIDEANQKIAWTKSYLGRHDVRYHGTFGPQGIVGTWNIRGLLTGPFHIWPEFLGEIHHKYLEMERGSFSNRG